MVPEKPTPFPFDPIPENNEKMKKWLLDYFASSTFNTYPIVLYLAWLVHLWKYT